MSLKRFEKKLDKILKKIQAKNNKLIVDGSSDDIYNQYHQFKKTLLNGNQSTYWTDTFASIENENPSTSLPEKAWLTKINSDHFRAQFKNDIMNDVQESGSVHAYYKKIKKQLKELKSNQVDFPIEYVVLSTITLMIIVGIILLVFCPVGGIAFVVGLSCVGTPMIFFLGLMIRQIIDPITCSTKSLNRDNTFLKLS
jgi:hypothetical protein